MRGSCPCGKVAYTTPDRFMLETSRDALTVYTFKCHVIRHQFCKTRGWTPFAEGIDLKALKITEFDGASLP